MNLLTDPLRWRTDASAPPPIEWNEALQRYEFLTTEPDGIGLNAILYMPFDTVAAEGDTINFNYEISAFTGTENTTLSLVRASDNMVVWSTTVAAAASGTVERGATAGDRYSFVLEVGTVVPVVYDFQAIITPHPDPNLTANDDTATTDIDTPVNVNVLANDTQYGDPVLPGDLWDYWIDTPPSAGAAVWDPEGAFITYTPGEGFEGSDSFLYAIQTPGELGQTAFATVTVTVGGGGPGPEPAQALPNCQCTDDTSDHRTLGELRTAVMEGLGFVDMLASGEQRTLGDMIDDVRAALDMGNTQDVALRTLGAITAEVYKMAGFADMVTPTAGTTAEIQAFVNQAQQILWKRLEYNGEGPPPPWMTSDTDQTALDGAAVQTIAVGLAKAHYGMPDAKAYQDYVEQYLSGLAQRLAPVATYQVTAALIRARSMVWNRTDALPAMSAPGDLSGIHYVPIELQAIANLKARLGHKDAELYRRDYERYITEAEKRSPPDATNVVTRLIQSAQTNLYRRYHVLRTERFYSWPLTEGVNLYDLPDNAEECPKKLDPREITWAGIERDGVWSPLVCGIPPELYTLESRSWPVRYEIRGCIEVWPTPDTTEGRLIIKGHFKPEPFVADSDRTTIDCEPVYLQAMANAKAHYRQPDARNYAEQLETLIARLVGGAHLTRRYIPGTRTLVPDAEPRWDSGTWP